MQLPQKRALDLAVTGSQARGPPLTFNVENYIHTGFFN